MMQIKAIWSQTNLLLDNKKQKILFVFIVLGLLGLSYYKFWLNILPVSIISTYFSLGFFLPILLKPFFFLWVGLGKSLGEISSFIVLFIFYYFICWPVSLFLKKKQTGWQDSSESDLKELY